jgi:histidinol-phosphatase (PHP family)
MRYNSRMIPQDYHMHSSFSCDSRTPMAAMCRAAIGQGIGEIGFAEHFDLHPSENEACRDAFRLEPWARELERCREAFAGQLTIRAGVEIGEPHIYAERARELLESYGFDYALGSLHWVNGTLIFDPAYFQGRPAAQAFGHFFEELERMTRAGDFDVLSHFDVPVRTGFSVYGGYDPREHEDRIRPVLRNCIERGIALDLNTAALRGRARTLTPGLEILRWYVEMGGERVTLGSDAHRPEHVGLHLEAALETAQAAGLQHLTFFEGREARLVRLERFGP